MPAVLKQTIDTVEVHPLVLLSVVDHYNRVAKGSKKRAVGCLLGYKTAKGTMAVMNSFAVPFDEETVRAPRTWFLDHNYLEEMFSMMKRVTAKEKIVGWYSTGPKLTPNDIGIHELFLKYTPEPLYCIVKVKSDSDDIPTESYSAIDIVRDDGRPDRKFQHVDTVIVASEPEEVGVEHLLRDVQNPSLSTLTTEVGYKISGLKGLKSRLMMIQKYLQNVVEGTNPPNQEILQNLQLIFNLLPNLNAIEMKQALAVKNNYHSVNVYVSSIVRAVLALDKLIGNKIENRERMVLKEKTRQEKDAAALEKEKSDKKVKSGKDEKAKSDVRPEKSK